MYVMALLVLFARIYQQLDTSLKCLLDFWVLGSHIGTLIDALANRF